MRNPRTTPKGSNPIQGVYGDIPWGWTGKATGVGGRRHTYQIFQAYGHSVWVSRVTGKCDAALSEMIYDITQGRRQVVGTVLARTANTIHKSLPNKQRVGTSINDIVQHSDMRVAGQRQRGHTVCVHHSLKRTFCEKLTTSETPQALREAPPRAKQATSNPSHNVTAKRERDVKSRAPRSAGRRLWGGHCTYPSTTQFT